MRKENRSLQPGQLHHFDFPSQILTMDPLLLSESLFADKILTLENEAFRSVGLPMPRWAFYDCSVMPGLVCGFAMKTDRVPEELHQLLRVDPRLEWTPISLFIAIPTAEAEHWMAHNLCSINSLLPKEKRLFGLGFLTKAFGLWYSNIKYLYGVTQWKNKAVVHHSNYGLFQIVASYSQLHNFKSTLTYRVQVNVKAWESFLKIKKGWDKPLVESNFKIHPQQENELIELQHRLEKGEGPFFLDGDEIQAKGIENNLILYRKK